MDRPFYVSNPVIEFTVKRRGQRVEALDAFCYVWAVRQAPAVKAIDLPMGQFPSSSSVYRRRD